MTKRGVYRRRPSKEQTMKEWQPIATAPRDGTPLLLLEPPELTGSLLYGAIGVGIWRAHPLMVDGGYWTNGNFGIQATHWMPLPEPPQ